MLTAPVGQPGKIEINTDFTLARSITSVANFPKRERISILTNANGDGTHQIVLRKRSGKPSDAGKTFAVREDDVGAVIDEIREALWDQKVTERRRSKEQLVKDLFRLAKPGNDLWTLVPGDHPQVFNPVIHNPADYVIQVTRPTSSGFAFPWALIYEIPLDDDQKRWKLCKLVEDWDGKTPLVTSSQQCCPHGKHSENVICPFGFWGFRYSIDQLSSTEKEDSIFSIAAPDAWEFVIGQTQYDVDKAALAVHVKTLDATLRTAFPAAKVVEGRDKATIRQLLGRDRPLVYLYCHGDRDTNTDPDTYLGVGNKEKILASEIRKWIQTWLFEGTVVWDKVRPLVFINACHSLDIKPKTLLSYLDAFVGSARAAGVIGTEVRVQQKLASEFAEQFFHLLLVDQKTVDEALRQIRLEYLADGNLLGLNYTPYCWSELRVTKQPTASPH